MRRKMYLFMAALAVSAYALPADADRGRGAGGSMSRGGGGISTAPSRGGAGLHSAPMTSGGSTSISGRGWRDRGYDSTTVRSDRGRSAGGGYAGSRGYVRGGGYYGDHDGGHGHHDYSSFSTSVYFGPSWGWGWPYYYPYSYYPYSYYPYYPPTTVIIDERPREYIYQESAPAEPSYWYFCRDPEGYYPYVKECPDGWEKVLPKQDQED